MSPTFNFKEFHDCKSTQLVSSTENMKCHIHNVHTVLRGFLPEGHSLNSYALSCLKTSINTALCSPVPTQNSTGKTPSVERSSWTRETLRQREASEQTSPAFKQHNATNSWVVISHIQSGRQLYLSYSLMITQKNHSLWNSKLILCT